MVQTSKGTVNEITVGSATGAVETVQYGTKHSAEDGNNHEDEHQKTNDIRVLLVHTGQDADQRGGRSQNSSPNTTSL